MSEYDRDTVMINDNNMLLPRKLKRAGCTFALFSVMVVIIWLAYNGKLVVRIGDKHLIGGESETGRDIRWRSHRGKGKRPIESDSEIDYENHPNVRNSEFRTHFGRKDSKQLDRKKYDKKNILDQLLNKDVRKNHLNKDEPGVNFLRREFEPRNKQDRIYDGDEIRDKDFTERQDSPESRKYADVKMNKERDYEKRIDDSEIDWRKRGFEGNDADNNQEYDQRNVDNLQRDEEKQEEFNRGNTPIFMDGYECLIMATSVKTLSICLFPQHLHNAPSDEIREYRLWTKPHFDQFLTYLYKFKNGDITVVDVGAELGLYTVFAAALGAHVVSIEPWYPHLKKIQLSLKENGLTDQVNLVQAALTDEMGYVSIDYVSGRVHLDYVHKDFDQAIMLRGGGVKKVARKVDSSLDLSKTVRSVNWDYLKHFIKHKYTIVRIGCNVFLKEMLKSAQDFIDKERVLAVFMDWRSLKYDKAAASEASRFLMDNSFQPRANISEPLTSLARLSLDEWPEQVAWLNLQLS